MAKASIKIEFNAGDNIEGAFSEAIRISKLLGVFVEFDFNGVNCVVSEMGDVSKGVEAYHRSIKSQDQYKFAVA